MLSLFRNKKRKSQEQPQTPQDSSLEITELPVSEIPANAERDTQDSSLTNETKLIITSWSGGSPGKTTVASNVAQTLASQNPKSKVGLLDFAVISPSLHNFLRLKGENGGLESILTISKQAYSDTFFWETALQSENYPNLFCWLGLRKNLSLIDQLNAITAEKIIKTASSLVDILIIDVQSDTTLAATDVALKMSTNVMVVVDQSINISEQTAKWLDNMYLRKFDIGKFFLVINQYSDSGKYSKSKITANLGLEVKGIIPVIPKKDFDDALISQKQLIDFSVTKKAFIQLSLGIVPKPNNKRR